MGSALNPDTYGQSTTGNANQIEDGVDFPHSGIIKALSDGMGQNYAIDGFDISGTNATALTVAAGKIFRDGQFVSVSGASLTLSSTYTNGYHLLVAPSGSTPTVVLRNPSAVDKVPDITSGDTIIAVITHTGVNPCSIQFLTVHKTEHSLSIGRDNSGYTEGLTIKSNAGDIEVQSIEQDKDIIFKVQDGSSVVDRLILYGDNDPSFPYTEVKMEGSLLVTEDIQANKIALGYGNSPTSGTAEISAYASSEPMVFKTGSAERVRITSGGKVGIGTDNPTGILHVKGTSSSDIDFLVEVAEDGGSASPDVVYFRNSASPAAGDDLAHLRFRGKDSAGSATDYVDIFAEIVDPTDGSEDGRITFRTLKNGAITSRIELDSDETVINDAGADINFRVEGDTNANLIFADAGNDRIGIGTSSPMNKLQVSHTGADGDNGIMIVREDTTTADTDLLGGIGFDSTDGNVPSSVLEASAFIAALAAEDQGTGDKGADLTFGTAAIDENDDTVSTEHMRILSDGKVGIGVAAPEHRLHIEETSDNYPFRLRGGEGNIRINKFGHIQIQNDNTSPPSSSVIDDPVFQIGQRDGGQLDISFGNIATQLVAGSDAILSLARASNSATGDKQMGFFGTTAISRPSAPSALNSISSNGTPADPEANADAINALITALTNLGLIG